MIINFEKLKEQEKKFIIEAEKIAKKSITNKNSFVGAIILGTKKGVYSGATIARTRAIGSTCSERMALDHLYFNGLEAPKTVFTIGTFERMGWSNDFVCTPCGVCLEMFFESIKFFNIPNINFVCSSWSKNKILKSNLYELFPQIGKGNWQRNEYPPL